MLTKNDVGEKFNTFLEEYSDKNIFIYGVSIKTKKVLDFLGNEKVSAIVSDVRIGEEIYDLEVIDVNTLKEGDVLILACYIGSLKIVYDRVKHIEERGVEILDLSLTNLTRKKNTEYIVEFESEVNIKQQLSWADNIVIDFKDIIGEVVNCKLIYREYFFGLINNGYAQNKNVYIRVDDSFDSEFFKEIGLLDKVKIIDENQDIANLLAENKTIHFSNKLIEHTENYKLINVPIPMEMLNNSNLSYLTENMKTNGDEIVFKLISNKLFYNPFSSNISIKSLEDLGYIAFAPLTAYFFEFVIKSNLDEDGIILFVSRDGYLLNELYEKYKKIYDNLPDNHYLYVSRRSAMITSIQSEEDIRNIVERELRFTVGNFRDRLEQKIGFNLDCSKKLDVDLKTITTDEQREELLEEVLKYKELILENAKKEREAYMKYLSDLQLYEYKTKYVYDLYTQGTIFSKMEEYFDDVALLCFAHGHDSRLENKNIISIFGENDVFYFMTFLKIYVFFEIGYASNDPQFEKIDEDGNPVFRDGTEYNYDKISQIQKGITKFIDDFLNIGDDCDISLECVDSILTLINKNLVSEEIVRNTFELENNFSAEEVKNMWNELMF